MRRPDIAFSRQRNLERQRVARIETGIHVLQARETFDEKPGAAEQHQRRARLRR